VLELPAEAAIGYHLAMVVSEVGSDPGTLAGLLSSFSKGKATGALDNELITDSLEDGKTFAGPWLAPLGFAVTSHDAACGVQMRTPKADQLILPGAVLTAADTTPVTTRTGTRSAVPSGF
jgi:hypothetical protein